MKTNISISWLCAVVMMLTLCAFCSSVLAAEFSADMIIIAGTDTVTNKLHVNDLKYRIELTEDGQKIAVIVDQGANLTRVLNISEKSYVEMPCDDMRSLTNDPFQSLKATIATPGIEQKTHGLDTLYDLKCEKHTLLWGGSEFYTYYVSEKYNFPVKIILGKSEMVTELRNIEESEIDSLLFTLPDGYMIVQEAQPVVETKPEETTTDFPEWLNNMTSAELVTPPFDKVISSGNMIRIKVVAGKSIWVNITNNFNGKTIFYTIPCLKGQPIDDPSTIFAEYGMSRMFEMMIEGQGRPFSFLETPAEADEIVIRVELGEITIKAEYNAK